MFSVVIPLYNKEHYITKCVTSVLGQTYIDFEILIVNDGSTDGSLSVAEQIEDTRIRIIDQENLGVSAARNNGVKAAQYDYIAFLDADDWWDKHFLEKMLYLIQDFPDAAIFGCQYYWVKDGRLSPSINHEPVRYRGYLDYFRAYTYAWWMPLSSISVVVRKQSFYELGGFKTTLRFGEDFDLWVRFALHSKIAYINEPLAFYNQDIEMANRAIGGDKIYSPMTHIIFNLSYFRPFEQMLPSLKHLLDGLRVRSLLPYYKNGQYRAEVRTVLAEVNFAAQPLFFRLIYRTPVPLVRLYFSGRRMGSVLKRAIYRLL